MSRSYDETTKAAVMASLLTGQSISSVAKEYKIPKGTVSYWKKTAQGVGQNPTQKKEKEARIGELLIQYLEANLKALKTQAEQFADKQWLSRQSADEVAVLHGVLTDKAIRLLEAFSANDSNTTPES